MGQRFRAFSNCVKQSLPREVVELAFLEVFERHIDVALRVKV